MGRSTGHLHMTIAVPLDVEPQSKQRKSSLYIVSSGPELVSYPIAVLFQISEQNNTKF